MTSTSSALRTYALVMTALTATLLIAGIGRAPDFGPDDRPRFEEIDVERINIVDADGTIKLVISNSARQVEATIAGETLPIERTRQQGFIFFNDIGDEIGGLAFGGDLARGGGGLMFDQFRHDQIIGLMHQEWTDRGGTRRSVSGLRAWDRPTDVTILDAIQRMEEVQSIEDAAEREAAIRALAGAERMFVGRTSDGEASVNLRDGAGRVRLRMTVSHEGEAKIEFLDEDGEVVRTIAAE